MNMNFYMNDKSKVEYLERRNFSERYREQSGKFTFYSYFLLSFQNVTSL